MGQENLLQLSSEGSWGAFEDQGQVYKKAKGNANSGSNHSYKYSVGEGDALGDAEG